MTQTSLDSILDVTLDDLADMPSIELFPNGAHKVSLEFVIDPVKVSVRMDMTYIECVELADPTAKAPAAGDKNSVFYNLKKKDGEPNAYAQGALKIILQALAPTFGGSNTTEICANSKGAEVVALTKIQVGKGDYRDALTVPKIQVV
jgi:hypothetical protein